MRSRPHSSCVVALLLGVAACGGGSPSRASGADASIDGNHGGTSADAGSTDEEAGVADGSASAPGDGVCTGASGPGAIAAPCSFDCNGKYVVSCLVAASLGLSECVEDKTTFADCTTEAESCVSNGLVAGPGCPTAGLAGCCFTPSTGAEVCLYDGDAPEDEQTCEQKGGVWSTTP